VNVKAFHDTIVKFQPLSSLVLNIGEIMASLRGALMHEDAFKGVDKIVCLIRFLSILRPLQYCLFVYFFFQLVGVALDFFCQFFSLD